MGWRTIVLTLCLLTTCACLLDGSEVIPMPAGLIGTWRTTDPDYAGRFFTLTDVQLLIGTGEARPERYRIVTVVRLQDEVGFLHTIEYVDGDGQQYHMALYYDTSGNGRVRLKNQPNMTWRKARR